MAQYKSSRKEDPWFSQIIIAHNLITHSSHLKWGQFTFLIPKPFIFHITVFTGTTCLLNLLTLITDKPQRTVNNVHIRDTLFFGKSVLKIIKVLLPANMFVINIIHRYFN